MGNFMKTNKSLILAIFCLIGFCAIAVLFKVFPLVALPASFVGAALGAVIVGVVTVILLEGQSRAEEVKERNVAVFKDKSQIFKKYISIIWKSWKDHKFEETEYFELTSIFYQELMLYLNTKSQGVIGEALLKIGAFVDKDINKSDEEELRRNIITIIDVLIEELSLGGKINPELFKKLDSQITQIRTRRQNRSFKLLGIKEGTELVFKKDLSIKCKTVDEKSGVVYEGKKYSISGLASELMDGISANGFDWFTLNEVVLSEMG